MKNKKIVQKAGSKFLVMSLSVAMIGGMMNASMFSPTTVLAEEADFAVEEIVSAFCVICVCRFSSTPTIASSTSVFLA